MKKQANKLLLVNKQFARRANHIFVLLVILVTPLHIDCIERQDRKNSAIYKGRSWQYALAF